MFSFFNIVTENFTNLQVTGQLEIKENYPNANPFWMFCSIIESLLHVLCQTEMNEWMNEWVHEWMNEKWMNEQK